MIKSLIKQSLSLAWPMAGSRVVVAFSNFFAMWLLARLGRDALAAGALVFVMQTTVTVVTMSLLFSIGPIVGRALGAGDYQKIGAVAQQGWLLSLFLTIPSILVLWFATPILLACRQNPVLAQIVGEYFHMYVWAVIPMFFQATNQMVIMSVGKQRLSFLCSCVSGIALLIFSPIFTFGYFSMPALGVQGVALGGVFSIWTGFLFACFYVLRLPHFAPFQFFVWRLRASRGYLKQILNNGLPIVIQMGGELFSWFVLILLVGWLGQNALAAQQISNQFNILILVPVIGLSQASGILIGQAAGAKRYHEVKQMGLVNIGIGIAIMMVVMILYLTIPKALVSVYLPLNNPHNQEIVHWAILLFAVSAFSMLFDTIRNIAMGTLRGLYDNKYPMYLSLIMTWLVGLPLGYLFAFHLHQGVVGFAYAGLIAVLIAAILLVYRWNTRIHHLLQTAEERDVVSKR